MLKKTTILLFTLIPCLLWAQQPANLTWQEFRSQVLRQHPVARQADLLTEQARFQLLRAKGGFDPKLYGDLEGKNFNEKTYFQYSEAGVKWPTWFGLELKGNYNRATGAFLNPEAGLPDAG